MTADNPLGVVAKWIANYEQHEQNLKRQLAALEAQSSRLGGQLAFTQAWLKQFRDLLSAMEGADKDALDLLKEDMDGFSKAEQGTHFDRIRNFLIARKNVAQTVSEIEAGTKIPRTSLTAVLYRTHAEKFEEHYPEGKRGKAWSLKLPEDVPFDPGGKSEDIPF